VRPHEPLQAIRRPGRQGFDDQKIGEQTLVRRRGAPVDTRGLQQGSLGYDAGSGQCVRFKVAAQTCGIPAGLEGRGIAGQKLIDVTFEPATAHGWRTQQAWFGESAGHGELQIAAQVRGFGGRCEDVPRHQAVDERPRLAPQAFPHGQGPHPQADDAPGSRPGVRLEIGPHRAGQQKLPGPRVLVDRSFDRPEHTGHSLPLVQKHRSLQPRDGCVGVGPESGSLRVPIEPHDRPPQSLGGGCLPARPGAYDQDRWKLLQELGKSPVSPAGQVAVHGARMPFSRSLRCYFSAGSDALLPQSAKNGPLGGPRSPRAAAGRGRRRLDGRRTPAWASEVRWLGAVERFAGE